MHIQFAHIIYIIYVFVSGCLSIANNRAMATGQTRKLVQEGQHRRTTQNMKPALPLSLPPSLSLLLSYFSMLSFFFFFCRTSRLGQAELEELGRNWKQSARALDSAQQ